MTVIKKSQLSLILFFLLILSIGIIFYLFINPKKEYVYVYKEINNNKLNVSPSSFSSFVNSYENKIPDYIFNEVKKYCYNEKNKELNIACISYLLANKLNFHYENDTSDSLKTIQEFVNDKGGDCEDYSFFFYKLINRFLEKEGVSYFLVLKEDKGKKAQIYKEGNVVYYVPNYSYEKIVPSRVEIVCYKISPTLGHCIDFFKESFIAFEPQNGEIKGQIIKRGQNYYLLYNNSYYEINILTDNNKLFVKKWNFWLESN